MKKNMIKRAATLLLACAMLITGLLTSAGAATIDSVWNGVSSTNWMAQLNGNMYITQVNLPGTHDAATRYMNTYSYRWSQCQGETIDAQLNHGVRFLDLRLAETEIGKSGDAFRLTHGDGYACYTKKQTIFNINGKSSEYLYLSTVIDWMYSFLKANPTEFIVATFQLDEGGNYKTVNTRLMDYYISKNQSMWYTGSTIPTVDQVRGKIVFFGLNQSGGYGLVRTGLGASEYWEYSLAGKRMYCENHWDVRGQTRWNYAEENLNRAIAEGYGDYNLYWTGMSAASTASETVSETANFINGKVNGYNWTTGKRYGWVLMDYVNESRARLVYATNPVAMTGSAVISGDTAAGSTLTATLSGGKSGTTMSYQWYRNGSAISGATGKTYKTVQADIGTNISVKLTGTGAYNGALSSKSLKIVARTVTGSVQVTGTGMAGSALTATVSLSPAETTYTGQWYRGGTAVSGATGSSYVLTANDIGKSLYYEVKGNGIYTGTVKSNSVMCSASSMGGSATIQGDAICGKTLTVNLSLSPTGATYTGQWYRDGQAISGATGKTYQLTDQDADKQITYLATATGNYGGTVKSAAVTCKTIAIGGSLTVEGAPVCGSVLSVKQAFTPANATVGLQWYRDGVAIPGATGNTYTLRATDVSCRITCTATGYGSYSGTVTSGGATVHKQVSGERPSAPKVSQTGPDSLRVTGFSNDLEYAVSRNAAVPESGWQTEGTFTSLDPGVWYVFNRLRETGEREASQAASTQVLMIRRETVMITDKASMLEFARRVSSGETDLDAVLECDMDLFDVDWTPLGTLQAPYTGRFNGNGYTCTGLNVDTQAECAGFFGYIKDAVVCDLTLEGEVTGAGSYVGAIAGRAEGGAIQGCTSRVAVIATDLSAKTGGLVGEASGCLLWQNRAELPASMLFQIGPKEEA